MRRIGFSVGFVFAFVTAAAFIRTLESMIPNAIAAPVGPQPKVQVENPLFDFGSAFQGQMVLHTFKIRNLGKGRLLISGVKTSCGCTAAQPTKTTLAPGEEAEITASFDTRFRTGHQLRTIMVSTNDPGNPSALMTIHGVVRQRVAATPAQVAFGSVRQGTEVTKEVTISDLAEQKRFKITSMTNSNVAIKVTQENRLDGKSGAVLKASLLKNMPVGAFNDTINVMAMGVPVTINVFGTVTGDLNVDPPQVSFGIVPQGGEATRIVELINHGQKPVKVLGLTSDTPAVTAEAELVSAGKEYKITVQLRRSSLEGQIRGHLHIRTDHPDQPTLAVPFYGIVGQFQM